MPPHISKLQIKGFKPFKDTTFDFGMLEVIAGANGSGKSSLFEFLKFIRDAADRDIPPEIISNSQNQAIFNDLKKPGFSSIISFKEIKEDPYEISSTDYSYFFHLIGNLGYPEIKSETLIDETDDYVIIDRESENGFSEMLKMPYNKRRLVFAEPIDSGGLSFYFYDWRFYSAFAIDRTKISAPMYIQQQPTFFEDCGNLSAVLHYFMTEHPDIFEELQTHLKSVVPGFIGLTVKARGGPGQVIAYWKEKNIDSELTLADVSKGILRLIAWFALCLHPEPPTLVCIDEPEMGVHPRALAVLAGLMQKLSERTQVLVATHSSYFLTQFELGDIAVMKKENGEAKFYKPKDSKVLNGILEDFGAEEIESLHRSDELEHFA